jgi:hypothetical protein
LTATPDSLDALDRRVYDLAVQPIPLAEIAVRLGVPVGQADERVHRVCQRLRVFDRAALRSLQSAPAPIADEYVINFVNDYVINFVPVAAVPEAATRLSPWQRA